MADTAITPPSRTTELERYGALLDRVESRRPIDGGVSRLADAAVSVAVRPGFDTVVSLPRLRFKPFEHQVLAAELVLRQMHGWAILADKAGLGKTIEAGLVISELRLRGLAARVAVLGSAGLVPQWQEELERKFGLLTTTINDPTGLHLDDSTGPPPIVLAALAVARRSPLRDALVDIRWDVVVVDGAHHLNDPSSPSARLVRDLRTRHLLLLTSTPVVRGLGDLVNLADLISPGVLGGAAQGSTEIRSTAPVIVRHRRADLGVVSAAHPVRVETLALKPTAAETSLYELVAERIRREGQRASPAQLAAFLSALRLAESSPRGLLAAAGKLGWDDLDRLVGPIDRPSKAGGVVDVVHEHVQSGEKVLVFTGFRRTLGFVSGVLARAGITSALYHGSLSRVQKDQAVNSFRGPIGVLLTTDAGGDARNLRFCDVVVNFDLPWNPLVLARRLGRVVGIGKRHEVTIANLVGLGTFEARLLDVFQAKLNLFELTVGEVDQVLGLISEDHDFERSVFDAYLASADSVDFGSRLNELGEALGAARQDYEISDQRSDTLVAALTGSEVTVGAT
jgi:SNF2 family DNA or RNA helicase